MRSKDYLNGYAEAWKDAITFLHDRAEIMNDPAAKEVLNVAAFNLGNYRKAGRWLINEKAPDDYDNPY